MSKRAVLYARVSSDDSQKEGRNLEGQLTMCREFAHARGWTIVAELAEDDKGASGAVMNLPRLNEILRMARASLIDVVVVREIDRFSRKLAKQLIVEEELRRCRVGVEYVLGEYPDTPEGNLNKNLKAVIAEYERTKIAERTMRSKRLIVENGGLMTHGRSPYGYRVVLENGKEQLCIDEEEARIVRLIYVWYTQGDESKNPMSIKGIARKLTDMRVPSYGDKRDIALHKKQEKGAWASASVAQILKNEAYAGTWSYGKRNSMTGPGRRNPASHILSVSVPAIVTRAQWVETQARLKYNRENLRHAPKHQHLMGRLLTCGECNRKMAGHVITKKTPDGPVVYRYYYCVAQEQGMPDCSQRNCFRADVVDDLLWQWVRSLLTDPVNLVRGLEGCMAQQKEAEQPKRERLAVVNDLIRNHQGQLEKLLDLYLDGSLAKELLLGRQNQLEQAIAVLERERTELQAALDSTAFSEIDLKGIQAFAAEISEGLQEWDEDFAHRRWVLERLNVTARLVTEGGEQVMYVKSMVGPMQFCVKSSSSTTRTTGTRR